MALLLYEGAIDGAYVDLQKVRTVLFEQRKTDEPAVNENDERLNGRQITFLAQAIRLKEMKLVARKYLNISHETIQNICYENKENLEAINRNIIRHWTRRNPGADQVKVSLCLFCHM